MLKKMQALGAAVLGGMLAVAACSSSGSDGGSGGTTSGGGGAGGTTSTGAQGGTLGHAGSVGHAGSSGSVSKAGSGGTTSNENGAGGEAGAPACPGCASGFCLGDGTCVDCLPSNDHCPGAEYCTTDNKCVAGCKANGTNCASGVCLGSHDCKSCVSDDECAGDGLVCSAGQCAPACSAAQEGQHADCSESLTCCSLHCTDLAIDSNNCGACGSACGNSQFCGLSSSCANSGDGGAGGAGNDACVACQATTIANLCAIPNIIVISDMTPKKNTTEGNLLPARAIAAGLHAQCTPTPTVSEELQDTPDALNVTTGHPVSGGGTLLVVAGGPYYQNLEGYFETSTSPLYATNVGDTQEFIERATGNIVVSRQSTTDNTAHDFFILQFMRDAGSGSLVLNAQGFWQSGTTAAAYEFVNEMLPALAGFDKAWYAFEWTDSSPGGDLAPEANEITLVSSGGVAP